MKRYALYVILVIVALVAAFAIYDRPLFYATAPLNEQSLIHLSAMQEAKPLSAQDSATAYLYFRTDYEAALPSRIQISTKTEPGGSAKVSFRNDRCEDDSVSHSIHRIYLRQDPKGHWVVERHEWSQKGRGRWGWTTQPTT